MTSSPMQPEAAESRSIAGFVRALARRTVEHQLPDVAAQLAFNTLLAVFPFAIFLVTILGFLPLRGVVEELLGILHLLLPPEAATLFDRTVHGVVHERRHGLLLVSLVGSMWAASGGVAALASSLDRIYGVRETRSWLRLRLQSLVVTVAATVLLVVACVALLIGPQIIEWISGWFGLSREFAQLWRLLRFPATVVAMAAMLAMLYWACPDGRHRFRFISPGSVIAVPLWISVSLLFKVFVRLLGSFNRTYGALGAGVVLLLWIYLSGLIVLVGGEINAMAARSPRRAAERDG